MSLYISVSTAVIAQQVHGFRSDANFREPLPSSFPRRIDHHHCERRNHEERD
ncbi:hypothetical protein LMG29542_08405 [Paraburkholderia humisilvae]|uniref:Uncharacterized protein n=1 Tax=Paraburkholderia humisilvae TaxID=627669 RepID=A0A6J5F9G8_9BURK|nr:hypothetical protein LMG29542_08405 [Paraburkholderia humisilvae]